MTFVIVVNILLAGLLSSHGTHSSLITAFNPADLSLGSSELDPQAIVFRIGPCPSQVCLDQDLKLIQLDRSIQEFVPGDRPEVEIVVAECRNDQRWKLFYPGKCNDHGQVVPTIDRQQQDLEMHFELIQPILRRRHRDHLPQSLLSSKNIFHHMPPSDEVSIFQPKFHFKTSKAEPILTRFSFQRDQVRLKRVQQLSESSERSSIPYERFQCQDKTLQRSWFNAILSNILCSKPGCDVTPENVSKILWIMSDGSAKRNQTEIFSLKGFVSKMLRTCLDLPKYSSNFQQLRMGKEVDEEVDDITQQAEPVNDTTIVNDYQSSEEAVSTTEGEQSSSTFASAQALMTTSTSSVSSEPSSVSAQVKMTTDPTFSSSSSTGSAIVSNLTSEESKETLRKSTESFLQMLTTSSKPEAEVQLTMATINETTTSDPVIKSSFQQQDSEPKMANRHSRRDGSYVESYMDMIDELMPSMAMIRYRLEQIFGSTLEPIPSESVRGRDRKEAFERTARRRSRWRIRMKKACRDHSLRGKAFMGDHLRDVVYFKDIRKAMVQSLLDVQVQNETSRLAMSKYLDLLINVFPWNLEPHSNLSLKASIRYLHRYLSSEWNWDKNFSLMSRRLLVPSKEHVGSRMEMSDDDDGHDSWIGCSQEGGYPCGLWQLFHLITVQHAYQIERGNIEQPFDVLGILFDYIHFFYTSTSKSLFQRFIHLKPPPMPALMSSQDQTVIWLWQTHNEMNLLLQDFAMAKVVESNWVEHPSVAVCNGRNLFPEADVCDLCLVRKNGRKVNSFDLDTTQASSIPNGSGNDFNLSELKALTKAKDELDLKVIRVGKSFRKRFASDEVIMQYLFSVYLKPKIV